MRGIKKVIFFTIMFTFNDNNTSRQVLGCISGGIGTIDPGEFDVLHTASGECNVLLCSI